MAEVNWGVWLPIVVAIISAIPGIIVLFKGKKKEEADVAETLVSTAKSLMETMEIKMDDLENDVCKLKALVEKYKGEVETYKNEVEKYKAKVTMYQKIQARFVRGIELLIKQLEENNIGPVWQPDVKDLKVETKE